MLDFVCIVAIFLEIFLTIFCVKKLIFAEKKLIVLEEKIVLIADMTLAVVKKVRPTVEKINKFISIVTNKNIIKISKIVRTTVDIIQVILLLKSLDFSKGIKSINFKNLKKILLLETSRRALRGILRNIIFKQS